MIIDKLENISLYSQIPDYVCEFLKTLSEDTPCGRYGLSETDYVNIETYTTKTISEGKFETHNNYNFLLYKRGLIKTSPLGSLIRMI